MPPHPPPRRVPAACAHLHLPRITNERSRSTLRTLSERPLPPSLDACRRRVLTSIFRAMCVALEAVLLDPSPGRDYPVCNTILYMQPVQYNTVQYDTIQCNWHATCVAFEAVLPGPYCTALYCTVVCRVVSCCSVVS